MKPYTIIFILGSMYSLFVIFILVTIVNPNSLFSKLKVNHNNISHTYFKEDNKFIRVYTNRSFVNDVPVGLNKNDIDTYQLTYSDYQISYHMNPPMNKSFCDKASVLVMILTKPDGFHTRSALRGSWLSNVSAKIAYHFIIGFTQNKSTMSALKTENSEHGDIVVLDIVDHYTNLTIKTGALMQWQQKHCPNVSYLVKADDDIAADLNRLLHFMRTDFDKVSSVNKAAIFGYVWHHTIPNRNFDSKWFVPDVAWQKNYFPDYCNGPMYVLTNSAVRKILQSIPKVCLLNVEDVLYTGVIAELAGIPRFDRKRIFGRGQSLTQYRSCDNLGVPYICSLYDFKLNSSYNPNRSNVISRAVKSLHNVHCT